MIAFITTMAWFVAVLSTIFTIFRLIGFFTYSDFDQLIDSTKGFKRTYPIHIPGSIAIICWSWIISQ